MFKLTYGQNLAYQGLQIIDGLVNLILGLAAVTDICQLSTTYYSYCRFPYELARVNNVREESMSKRQSLVLTYEDKKQEAYDQIRDIDDGEIEDLIEESPGK